MKLCPSCSRYLRADTAVCPFCTAKVPTSPAKLLALSLAVGLAVSGCAGDDGETSESSASTTSSSTTTTTTTTSTTTSVDDSSMSVGVAAYASPPDSTGQSTAGAGNDEAPGDDESPDEKSDAKPDGEG